MSEQNSKLLLRALGALILLTAATLACGPMENGALEIEIFEIDPNEATGTTEKQVRLTGSGFLDGLSEEELAGTRIGMTLEFLEYSPLITELEILEIIDDTSIDALIPKVSPYHWYVTVERDGEQIERRYRVELGTVDVFIENAKGEAWCKQCFTFNEPR